MTLRYSGFSASGGRTLSFSGAGAVGYRGLSSWDHGRPQSEVFEGACDSMGSFFDVARGAFLCRAHFGDDAWPADGLTRTDKWNCAPSSVGLHPVGDSLSPTRTGAALLAAFRTLNGPLRHSQTSKRQVRDAPEARSGVVARASSVAKRRPVPIGGLTCGGVH